MSRDRNDQGRNVPWRKRLRPKSCVTFPNNCFHWNWKLSDANYRATQ